MQQSQFDHEALSLTPYILLTILDIHTLQPSLIHKLVNAQDAVEYLSPLTSKVCLYLCTRGPALSGCADQSGGR